MSDIVRYSTALTPNPVVEYRQSVNTPDFEGQSNVLVNPNLSAVAGFDRKYWKHVAGAIQLMTQGERDAVDAAIATAILTAQRTGAKNVFDSAAQEGKILKAVVLLLIDELNDLRGWIVDFKAEVAAATNLANLQTRVAGLPNMPDRTSSQARTAIRSKIDDGSAD